MSPFPGSGDETSLAPIQASDICLINLINLEEVQAQNDESNFLPELALRLQGKDAGAYLGPDGT